MRVSDLLEMNIPRDRAIAITENLEDQINAHLIKLFGMTADDGVRNHWKKELRAWFRRLAAFRLKGKGKQKGMPLPAKVYYDHLYDHMYGGHEVQNVNTVLRLLVEDGYARNTEPVGKIVTRLRMFHQQIAQRMSTQQEYDDLIDQL
jgi:hypothetical protein